MSSAGFAHHGGQLAAARAAYSRAPQPWIDLSTGINPRSYPAPRARGVALNRLPDIGELARLEAVAAAAFGVADPRRVVATGGTEPALRLLPYVVGVGAGVDAGGCDRDVAAGTRAGSGVGIAVGAHAGGGIAAAAVAGPTYGS